MFREYFFETRPTFTPKQNQHDLKILISVALLDSGLFVMLNLLLTGELVSLF